jgi:TonB-linked SusC/RagA family outer membrane protein
MTKLMKAFRKYVIRLLALLSLLFFVTQTGYGGFTETTSFPNAEQGLKISGKIVDADGKPLPGVNVLEIGTTNGVITDLDGNYSITVSSEDARLQFSFIGYLTEEVEVSGKTRIDIVLVEDIKTLDEVVVVGYGVKQKENLTGSVATVSAEEIESRPITGLAEALNGAVANLSITPANGDGGKPGAEANYQLRGVGTIGEASSEPLFIIDGVEGDPNLVNPSDIESISVLKDAAAASIFGAKASYGAIVITTKKGEKGEATINFSANRSWRDPFLPRERLGSLEHMEYWQAADLNEDGQIHQTDGYPDEIIQMLKERMENPSAHPIMPRDPDDPSNWFAHHGLAIDEDWFHAVYNKMAPTQDYNLSVSGGGENNNYYFSAGFMDQDGLYSFDTDHYKRYSFLGKYSGDVTKWLNLSYRMQFVRRDVLGGPSFNRYRARLVNLAKPNEPVQDPYGHYRRGLDRAYYDAQNDQDIEDNFNNTFSAKINPFEGFNIFGDFTFNLSSNDDLKYSSRYPNFDANNNPIDLAGSSEIEKEKENTKFYDVDIHATYNKTLGSHDFSLLAGYQQQYTHNSILYAFRNERMSDDIYSIVTATGNSMETTDLERELATIGYFGRLNYAYQGKYLLEANFRYDGNSRFADGYKWGFFPSASVGYIVSRESFFQPLTSWMNFFKVRGSYGKLGNMRANYWYFNEMATMSRQIFSKPWLSVDGQELNYMSAPELSMKSLTWEKPITTNLGADINFFNNKLQTSFDWYTRITQDMVGPPNPLPGVLGVDELPQENNTELKSQGWELMITHKNSVGEFNYNVTVGVSRHQETVTKYNADFRQIPDIWDAVNGSGNMHYYEGMKLGEIWGYTTVGFIQDSTTLNKINQGPGGTHSQHIIHEGEWGFGDIMYADLNGDSIVSYGEKTIDDPGDLSVIGNETPDFSFYFSIGAQWKGFDVRTHWVGEGPSEWAPSMRDGYPAKFQINMIKMLFWGSSYNDSELPVHETHKDHWRPDNTDAYWPRPHFAHSLAATDRRSAFRNTQVQTRYLQNGAFLKLRNIQIGYSLPEKWLERIKFSRARIYISGENLLTITNLRIFDPEDKGMAYPLQKVYSAGINVQF